MIGLGQNHGKDDWEEDKGKIEEVITRVCKVCGKEGEQTVIGKHIEAKHIGKMSFNFPPFLVH